jgi:heme exporter protein C
VIAKILELLDDIQFRLFMGVGCAFLIITALYMALLWSPDTISAATGLPEPPSYRIIHFHVPSAITTYVGYLIVFVGSILYLWKKDLRYDRWALVGCELGVLFNAMMLMSGMIWGRHRWGAWWIWEPRLTTAFILLIIFIGYLILRAIIDNEVTRARFAAVFGIIGFIDVPIVHYSIKIWGNIMHPVVIKSVANTGMPPDMILTLRFSGLAFGATFVTIYLLRLRAEILAAEVNKLRLEKNDG